MSYRSDPTASMALGGINREFSRLEKKAKKLVELLEEGKITPEAFEKAQGQFRGIYSHVLTNALEKSKRKQQDITPPAEESAGVIEMACKNYLITPTLWRIASTIPPVQ